MKIRYVLCVLLCNFVSCFITTAQDEIVSRDCGTTPVTPKRHQRLCGCYPSSSADELAGLFYDASHACPTSPDKDFCPTSPDKRIISSASDCPTTPPSPKVRRVFGCPTSPDKDACPTSPIDPKRRHSVESQPLFVLVQYLIGGGYQRPTCLLMGRSIR